ncbi:MAG: DUF1080 domain-containing protein [Dehalococcoidia bacterium]
MTSERRQLFNGRDLTGWEMVGHGSFRVEDGLLVSEGGMGLLWYTEETFGDTTLHVEYRVSRVEDNSGVFVRIADRPPNVWFPVHHGYEVQILETGDEFHRTGGIYSITQSPDGVQLAPGEWNTMDITLEGLRITVVLNGTTVTAFDPEQPIPERQYEYEPERGPRPERGYIGLQNHDGESVVAFREVSVA